MGEEECRKEQMFITALEAADLPWATAAEKFHIQHGEVRPLV